MPPSASAAHVHASIPPVVAASRPAGSRSFASIRLLRPASRLGSVAGLALLAGACASAPPPAAPAVDVGAVEREASGASTLDRPYRVVFDWSFQEPGMRVNGRGVARLEPPFRARLDLFAANGERLGAAALVNDDLVVPAGMAVAMPPSPMLWGALGVFRPGPGVYGASAERPSSNRASIRYLSSEGGTMTLHFRDRRIERMERSGDEGTREEVRVTFGGAGERFPRESVYRDLGAVRELRIRVDSVEPVESFPEHIWTPDASSPDTSSPDA
jgi:hypothetical protein